MRKIAFTFLLIITLVCSIFSPSVFAEELINTPNIHNADKANTLKEIGLFAGTEKGFELDRAPTRVEGAIMLLRLMGKEEEAKNSNYECPFSDVPKWASKQIGYMYAQKLTNGVSTQTYGASQNMTASQYVTLVLRALGYNDAAGDFAWQTSIDKAAKIGLLSDENASALKQKAAFLRDDVVGISYNALLTSIKGSDSTLIRKLVLEDKTVSVEAAEKSSVWNKSQNNNATISSEVPAIENPCEIANEYLTQNGLAYTMTDAVESINGQEYHLTLLFHVRNAVYPEAPQEQNFKIYHNDGSIDYQSFPFERVSAEWISRRIKIDRYDGKRVAAIELGPDPSSNGPEKDTLKWDILTAVEQAVAKGDSEPPVLHSIEVLQNSVSVGDKITVKAVITDKVGIKSAEVSFMDPNGRNSEGVYISIPVNLVQILGTDVWQGDFTVRSIDTKGLWKISTVFLEDNSYNFNQIYSDDLPDVSFTIK